MRSGDKRRTGMKPVRRSNPQPNEPARAYLPRTARNLNLGKKTTTPTADNPTPTEKRKIEGSRVNRTYGTSGRPSTSHTTSIKRSGKDNSARGYQPRTYKGKTLSSSFGSPQTSPPITQDNPSEIKRNTYKKGMEDKRPYNTERKPFKRNERANSPRTLKKRTTGESPQRSSFQQRGGQFKNTIRKFPKKQNDTGFIRQNSKANVAPQIEADLKTDTEGYIRLNKFIANSGLCSRREADAYIEKGQITVNGQPVTQLGSKVKLTDEIRFKGNELDPESKVYILLNKPKDYITTVDDPNAKQTVMELIEGACQQRVYPVGRLDRNSTGLLLLTNDGELTKRLTHPSHNKKKVYEVALDRPLDNSDADKLVKGVTLEDGEVKADAVEYINASDLSRVGVEIHSGQNRVIRRLFEAVGYRVRTLDRVYFAGLTKKSLPRGKWRFLSPKEVQMLQMNRY